MPAKSMFLLNKNFLDLFIIFISPHDTKISVSANFLKLNQKSNYEIHYENFDAY